MLSQSFEVGFHHPMDIEEYIWTHVTYDSLSIYFVCFVFVINVFILSIINNADCHKQADLFSVSCDSTVWWTTISGKQRKKHQSSASPAFVSEGYR